MFNVFEHLDRFRPRTSRFGHSPAVHVIGLLVPLAFGGMAFESLQTPNFRGGTLERAITASVCAVFAIGVALLYLKSGVQRYEIADSGLVILRPWCRMTIPWTEIHRIEWLRFARTFVIRSDSSILFFTSSDFFPRLHQFVTIIHERSGCEILMK